MNNPKFKQTADRVRVAADEEWHGRGGLLSPTEDQ